MKRTSFANWPCSVARTVNLLGDWWTPLADRVPPRSCDHDSTATVVCSHCGEPLASDDIEHRMGPG